MQHHVIRNKQNILLWTNAAVSYCSAVVTVQHLWLHWLAEWLVCTQAVALVFDHVLVEMEQMGSSSLLETALPAPSEPSSAKGPETPKASKSPRGHGTTNAALKLLDDLCMMATGDLSMHPT